MKTSALILISTLLGLSPLLPAEQPAPQPIAATEAQQTPFFRTALYPAWSRMTPQQALHDVRIAIAEARERYAAIAAVTPETATFQNTFLALYEADENIKQAMNYVYHLHLTLGDREMQHMMETLMQETTAFRADGTYTARIAEVLRNAASAPWVQELSPAKQRFVQQTMAQLTESGIFLSPEQQARKAQIELELTKLGFRFSQYAKVSPQVWELVITDPEELKGMPQGWINRAAQEAQQRGLATPEEPAWLINLTTAPANAVLQYCEVPETRRRCWLGVTSAGTSRTLDTEPIIARILELRHELANLRGYKNFADMEAAHRMMGSGEAALAFINDLLERSKPAWDAYVASEMQRYPQACGQELTTVNPWDTAYLNRHFPPQRNQFDVRAITPYLQESKVLDGLLNIWSNLLGLKFEELPCVCLKPGEICPEGSVEVWHPSVRCFTAKDAETGTHVGSFYLDLYKRQGKRSMAWCIPLRDGTPAADGSVGEPHLAALVANFAPPTPGRQQLLHHGDLYMLFHEFGHLMHMMLGHGEIRPHCTAEVERDFVEMPSHLQENWIWEPEALATFAFHHATGEPLPAELAQQLAASRGSNPIESHMRMLLAAKLDLELHMHYMERYRGRPLDEVTNEIVGPWLFPYTVQPPSELRTLTHVFSEGYAACLYTYKWCEVLAADAFSRFRQEGILNPATGAAYRRAILNRGSSIPAAEQIREFLGRDPSPEALIRQYTQP